MVGYKLSKVFTINVKTLITPGLTFSKTRTLSIPSETVTIFCRHKVQKRYKSNGIHTLDLVYLTLYGKSGFYLFILENSD